MPVRKTVKLFGEPIKAIIGGTHMLEYSKEDIEHVGDVLEKVYGTPQLYSESLHWKAGDRAVEDQVWVRRRSRLLRRH